MEPERRKFVIMKKIAKHGKQNVIVMPRMLKQELKPGTIVQLNIEVVKESEESILEVEK